MKGPGPGTFAPRALQPHLAPCQVVRPGAIREAFCPRVSRDSLPRLILPNHSAPNRTQLSTRRSMPALPPCHGPVLAGRHAVPDPERAGEALRTVIAEFQSDLRDRRVRT